MKDFKMIITDLNMTVLHTDKSISEYTRDVFSRCVQNNIITAIATARYNIGAERYINDLKPDYEITTDGTMTYKKGVFMFGTGFDIDTSNSIINEVLSIGTNLELTVATDRCVYWNSKNISESPVLHKAIYNNYSSPITECAYKIFAELPEKLVADKIGDKYACKVISYRDENRYGFIHAKAGKIQALYRLVEYLNIKTSEVIAFGDDSNDIEMLTECGYGVAVENAVPSVKKIADFICESNDNDGVAKWIEENVL